MSDDRKFRSIVDELLDYAPTHHTEAFLESRGQQVIASAAHLMRHIRETYDESIAEDLSRRLIRAIATGDEGKFRRKLQAIAKDRQP